jgi:cell division protein FtsL
MNRWKPIRVRNNQTKNLGGFRKIRLGSMSVNSMAIVLCLVLGVFYVVAVNVTSTKGGQLHTLQLQKDNIVAENERLQLEAARLASLAVIEGEAEEKIEIGEDGKPTGRILKETPKQETEEAEEISYIPKMIQAQDIEYVDWLGGALAHK